VQPLIQAEVTKRGQLSAASVSRLKVGIGTSMASPIAVTIRTAVRRKARDPMALSAGQWWALDIAVSVPVAVATARMLAVAVSVLVFVPDKEAVGMA